MATVAAEIEIAAQPVAVWDLYFDPASWPEWVDQYARVVESDGYPEANGTLRWRSGKAGRGEVTERVLEHEPRHRHRIAFSDPDSEGELITVFTPIDGGTRCRQEMTYNLRQTGLFARAADLFFVRSQMQASLERSLLALRAELEGR
jgi:uncharacterized protein YndB with AHSA1/START domain